MAVLALRMQLTKQQSLQKLEPATYTDKLHDRLQEVLT